MKNYPNQAAEFSRVRSTLNTISSLNAQGLDVLDDGVLGYELARSRDYTFRGIDYTTASAQDIEARIVLEKAKPRGDQGARTNARELRRTLRDLGWLDSTGAVTSAGRALLACASQSQTERDLLAAGLMRVAVADAVTGRVSHPVRMMLHLLHAAPSHRRLGLELALENLDDSPSETSRVIGLYQQNATDAQIRAATGVTENQQKNNRKIFPTLAKYAGLVVEDAQHDFHLTPSGRAAIGLPSPSTSVTATPTPTTATALPSGGNVVVGGAQRQGRNLTVGRKRSVNQVGSHSVSRTVPAALTPDQQAEAQTRLGERTTVHQALVRQFAARIGDAAGEFWEDPASFDLVWAPTGVPERHIFEMKTIQSDADPQIIRAIGQLSYYAYFNVAKAFPGAPATKTVVVNDDLHQDLRDFLEHSGVGALRVHLDGTVEALNPLGQAMVALLP
ncbi:hypothetical protein [Xylanimonas protaetiae]|uniref:Uncharacterized protein n=1 Tax=Xylanimonas protaetiae TaxID=2509457 RepID=A0A4P6F253_9MICO|nr:hypothetical protein [Xylanimonas protaetiae]QAY69245.1 hypothetical protein ET471_03655 [Xylanimonas protaetiae]